jgi:hypothetical protein
MAHWAQIDENNKVTNVVVTNNNDNDEGYQWLIDNLGGTWVKTSYNSYGGVHYLSELDENNNKVPSGKPHLRYNYASIGFTYDEINDAFIPPKPSNITPAGTPIHWVLNTNTFQWDLVEALLP